MKILFYLGHPAHYHNVSKVLPRLKESGHNIIIYARGKDVLFDLINELDFKVYKTQFIDRFSRWGNIVIGTLKREFELFKICKSEKPDLLVGTDIVITHIGKLLKLPSIVLNEDDSKAVPLLAKYGFKYSTYTLSPNCCDISPYNHKKVAYPSYHELGYLHPNHFNPNKSIVEKLLGSNPNYFIVRFSNLKAHHDKGKRGISNQEADKIVDILNPHGRVLITSERALENNLEKYRIPINLKDIHHFLYYARIYIGDGQTMATEAGVLGTPFIRYNDFVGELGIFEELENKYNIGFGIKPGNFNKMVEVLKELISDDSLEEKWQEKRKKMLNEKIDFSKYLYWFFHNYPQSAVLAMDKSMNFNIFK